MLICLFILALFLSSSQSLNKNDRPIIGILAQKYYGDYLDYGSKNYSYIPASYIKFVESSGARPVPIHVNMSEEYYHKMFNSINGILFPGGEADLRTSGYAKAGKIFYNLAVTANKKGDYFPIFGICLGFEFLTLLAAHNNYLQNCSTENVPKKINFDYDYKQIKKTKMFSSLNQGLYHFMKSENVTIHFHHYCITKEAFLKAKLNFFFDIIAQNKDLNGLKFVSIIEAKFFPFYGVAFHPEKNLFEFILTETRNNIPHSFHSILTSQYFANFFINEARKNYHKFDNVSEETQALIYNYKKTFVGAFLENASFEEVYFFDNDKIYG